MEQTWRWFVPEDLILLAAVRQAGANGIVTPLHQIPYGVVWSVPEIEARKARLRPILPSAFAGASSRACRCTNPSNWEGDLDPLFDNYRQSLRNLASCGVTTICYNFMPVLDWTRTELAHPLPGGATALRFNAPNSRPSTASRCNGPVRMPTTRRKFWRGPRHGSSAVRKRSAEIARAYHGRTARRI